MNACNSFLGIIGFSLSGAVLTLPYFPYYPAKYPVLQSIEFLPPNNFVVGVILFLFSLWVWTGGFAQWLSDELHYSRGNSYGVDFIDTY